MFLLFQSTNGALKTINSSRLTVDVEGYLHFSNVTRKASISKNAMHLISIMQWMYFQDNSDEFLYACSAASYFRNEYKLGNRVFLQVKYQNVF